eukprot:7622993-Heterocapsa_arctica.AAC.1
MFITGVARRSRGHQHHVRGAADATLPRRPGGLQACRLRLHQGQHDIAKATGTTIHYQIHKQQHSPTPINHNNTNNHT